MIDLSRNEHPAPPPEEALQRAALRAMVATHRYPTELLERVTGALAREHARTGEAVLLTRGVDEAIDLFLERYEDRQVVLLAADFAGFVERLDVRRRSYRRVALGRLSGTDGERVHAACAVLLSSPNNPCGFELPEHVLSAIARAGCAVFLDRAYRHFARDPDVHDDFAGADRFRFYTFSKAHALAGLRLGLLAGPAAEITAMQRRQRFCEIDSYALAVLEEVLQAPWAEANAALIVQRRTRLVARLRQLGMDAVDTETNFVLLRDDRAAELHAFLRERGIAVQPTDVLGLPDHLRVGVPDDAGEAALYGALAAWRPEGAR